MPTKIECFWEANFIMAARISLFTTRNAHLKRNYGFQHDRFRVLSFHHRHQQNDDLWWSVITNKPTRYTLSSVLEFHLWYWPVCVRFKIEVFRDVTPCFFGSYFLFFTAGKRKFLETQKLFAVSQNLVERRRKLVCVLGKVSLGVDPLI